MLMDKHQLLVMTEKIIWLYYLSMWNQEERGTGEQIIKEAWIFGMQLVRK